MKAVRFLALATLLTFSAHAFPPVDLPLDPPKAPPVYLKFEHFEADLPVTVGIGVLDFRKIAPYYFIDLLTDALLAQLKKQGYDPHGITVLPVSRDQIEVLSGRKIISEIGQISSFHRLAEDAHPSIPVLRDTWSLTVRVILQPLLIVQNAFPVEQVVSLPITPSFTRITQYEIEVGHTGNESLRLAPTPIHKISIPAHYVFPNAFDSRGVFSDRTGPIGFGAIPFQNDEQLYTLAEALTRFRSAQPLYNQNTDGFYVRVNLKGEATLTLASIDMARGDVALARLFQNTRRWTHFFHGRPLTSRLLYNLWRRSSRCGALFEGNSESRPN